MIDEEERGLVECHPVLRLVDLGWDGLKRDEAATSEESSMADSQA